MELYLFAILYFSAFSLICAISLASLERSISSLMESERNLRAWFSDFDENHGINPISKFEWGFSHGRVGCHPI